MSPADSSGGSSYKDNDDDGGAGGGGGEPESHRESRQRGARGVGTHRFLFSVTVKWPSNCDQAAAKQIAFLKAASLSAIHQARGRHTQSVCST